MRAFFSLYTSQKQLFVTALGFIGQASPVHRLHFPAIHSPRSLKMFYAAHTQAQTHLISTKRLSELIDSKLPSLVVLDVSLPMPGEQRDCRGEFLAKHIPGAQFLDLKECREKDTDNAYMLPSLETFKECIEKLAVINCSKVVVYDANEKKGMFSSPRAWYMFRVFGHREIYVLDGGLSKWIADGKVSRQLPVG